MTTAPPPHGRDWDAEFNDIVGNLDLASAPPSLPASRQIVVDPSAAERTSDVPSEGDVPDDSTAAAGSNETVVRDCDGANDGAHASSAASAHTHTDVSATGPVPPENRAAVPGFNPQWRVSSEQAPALHAEPTIPAEPTLSDLDEDFVPPDPQPLDSDDPATTVMIAALVLGPLWLIYLVMFDRYANWLWWSLATLLTVGGFVLAIARQPKNRDEDDPDDDGARV